MAQNDIDNKAPRRSRGSKRSEIAARESAREESTQGAGAASPRPARRTSPVNKIAGSKGPVVRRAMRKAIKARGRASR